MKKLIVILISAFFMPGIFAQTITGGGGVTICTGDPNSITAIAARTGDGPYYVYRTDNASYYYYDNVQTAGSKWQVVDFTTILSETLTSGDIFVGNGSGVATGVTMSGDATLSNTGVLTLSSTITAGGPTGSTTAIPVLTWDAKGRLTAVTTATVAVQGVSDAANGLDIALSANNVTVAPDFTELTALATAPDNGDIFMVYDTSASAHKSITYANILAGVPANTNFTSTDLTATEARTHTMLDNNASALKIGSAGAANLFELVTTNGAEQVKVGNAFAVTGASTFTGAVTANGNVTWGDAGTDSTIVNSINMYLPNLPAYASNSAAVAALGANRLYKLSAANIYGLPKNVVMLTE